MEVGNAVKCCDFESNVYGANEEKSQQLQHVAGAFAGICRALCCASTVVRSV